MIPAILWNLLHAILGILELLILARAILSFIVSAISSSVIHRIYEIILTVTEPLLMPIRTLLDKVPFLQQLPIDFSPVVLLLLISFVGNAILWL